MSSKSECLEAEKIVALAKTAFIQIQLFARPEDEGRTEEATAHKKRKSRDEGKVAYSQELGSAITIVISCFMFFLLGGIFLEKSKSLFVGGFKKVDQVFDERFLVRVVHESVVDVLTVVSPVFVVVVFLGLIGSAVQVGVRFTPKALKWDFKKISFTSNKMFSKIFFSRQTAFNLVKSVCKVLLVVVVTYMMLSVNMDLIVNTLNMDVSVAFAELLDLTFLVGIFVSFIFLVLSVPDYFFQRQEHFVSLKMTRHELKEERRDTEGDVHVKQRLQERQRALLNRKVTEEVPKSDVVITNPTHYAVAIRYDVETMVAPIVVAKGKDYMALRIKELAKENDVHIVEDRLLARGLYEAIDVGDEVPEDFYQALAEILAFVIRAREEVRG